jgi:putative ATPase
MPDDDLFAQSAREHLSRQAPLAVRVRPGSLGGFVGQEQAVGPGTPLRREIEQDAVTSLILYGPPGSGKTSLARVIAETTKARFVELSAVDSGVKDVRAAIDEARDLLGMEQRRTILFIDEIHRFNRSQQDALLHAVEDGLVILVGATTENPFFEVNAPLISRSRVVELVPLSDDAVRRIVERAVVLPEGLDGSVTLADDGLDAIVVRAGGDARIALTTLESAAVAAGVGGVVDAEAVTEASQSRVLPYDRKGDVHYDVTSAFIKSMRGSDPDAAVYWLARMVHGGEDPKFIARRMLVFAAEDVGNADPDAVLVAHAAVKAAEFVGWPECRINLAQAAIYLSLAPRSNAAYRAIDAALAEVERGPAQQVPSHLRDASYRGARQLGRGEGYEYPHAHADAVVDQQYLPDGLVDRRFYEPGERGWEAERVADLHAARKRHGLDAGTHDEAAGDVDDGGSPGTVV